MDAMSGWVACRGSMTSSKEVLEGKLDEVSKAAKKHGLKVCLMLARTWDEQTIPFIKVRPCGISNTMKIRRSSLAPSKRKKRP